MDYFAVISLKLFVLFNSDLIIITVFFQAQYQVLLISVCLVPNVVGQLLIIFLKE